MNRHGVIAIVCVLGIFAGSIYLAENVKKEIPEPVLTSYTVEYYHAGKMIYYWTAESRPYIKDNFTSFNEIATDDRITVSGDVVIYPARMLE